MTVAPSFFFCCCACRPKRFVGRPRFGGVNWLITSVSNAAGREQVGENNKAEMWGGPQFLFLKQLHWHWRHWRSCAFKGMLVEDSLAWFRDVPRNFAAWLCSHFNSVRKVREVSGQSVAHLYWSATCCSTRTQSLETRSTTALYWPQAAWRPGWNAHCYRWFFVKSVHSLKNL